MSFRVLYPFDESTYPEDLRALWRALPAPVRAVLIETGRKFGSHAMVQGAVPVLFPPEVQPLLWGQADGRYIQNIPAVYGEVPGKLWIDADVLNYAAALGDRVVAWSAYTVPGTRFVCLANVGRGAAADVAIERVEAAGVKVTGHPSRVEPDEGLLLSFRQGFLRPAEVSVAWVGEDGVEALAQVPVPAPVCRAGGEPQRMPSAMAGDSAAITEAAMTGSKAPRSRASA